MAGDNHTKRSSASSYRNNKPSSSTKSNVPSSASQRKSRWESNNSTKSPADPKQSKPSPSTKTLSAPSPAKSKPNAAPSPGTLFPFPDLGPPPLPAYGFHMLERRTLVLADGSVRSYFALPPDYQDFTPPPRPFESVGFDKRFRIEEQLGRGRHPDSWNAHGFDGRGGPEGSMKRKYGNEDPKDTGAKRDDLARQKQAFLQNGDPNGFPGGPLRREWMDPRGENQSRASKYMRVGGVHDSIGSRLPGGLNSVPKHLEVDQGALNKAFLRFAKLINENATQRKSYLEDGKNGRLQCIVCSRSSPDFPEMHALIMHTYNSDNADLRLDHLGFHKALCVLMGWNYFKPPDNSKAYRILSAEEAAAHQDDLIMWPPLVVIHNTITGKGKDGRTEGMGNKTMDNKMRDLGFGGGKSKSLYGRDGHLGITLIKFSGDQSGLKEAMRLAEYFEKDNRGRKAWARLQPITLCKDADKNPNLVRMDEKGEKNRILYGYLGTAFDLDKVDFDTRKKVLLESLTEYNYINRHGK